MSFGPYEIKQSLGKGGMAETFLAVRKGPEGFRQEVCLKLMLPHRRSDADVVRGFVREARLLAGLRHPNIVQVLDFGEHERQPFMALEWVDGIDLRELMRARRAMRRPLAEPLVRYLAIELASALHAAHTARTSEGKVGILHRDLSPENVLLSRAGAVKLGDFGLAKTSGEEPFTAEGVIKGKVPYMAPDYAESGVYDASCDHYSLAVLLFEALTGKLPFNGRTDLELMDQARRAARPGPKDMPMAAEALASFIQRGLAMTSAERYATPDDMLEAALAIERPARAMRDLAELIDAIKPAPSPDEDVALSRPSLSSDLRTSHSRKPVQHARRSAVQGAALLLSGVLVGGGALWLSRADVDRQEAQTSPASAVRSPVSTPSPLRTEVPPAQPAQAATPVHPAAAFAKPPVETTPVPARSVPSKRPGRVRVVAIPFGKVWVDGTLRGAAPIELELSPGSHQLAVGKREPTEQQTISVRSGESREVVVRYAAPP